MGLICPNFTSTPSHSGEERRAPRTWSKSPAKVGELALQILNGRKRRRSDEGNTKNRKATCYDGLK